jgi:hypothetical protein
MMDRKIHDSSHSYGHFGELPDDGHFSANGLFFQKKDIFIYKENCSEELKDVKLNKY